MASAEVMELELGKLFVGGIPWDTDEVRLKEYFRTYGEVVETVIMRDRITGRARGFGFVVFADPAVAERVVMEKHIIDGRKVEAKKAVPRDDLHISQRNSNSIHGSPGPGRTKKIFVGGLASTVTETDFKKYFDQFGTITDVVVMYDHNTQRPRGFGFITYDSEEAVDRVLHKTFHELNGKMVEVKRAVPKELSSGTSWSPAVGYNYNLSRTNSILNNNLNSIKGYGMRMHGRYSPVSSNRGGFTPLGSSGYGMSVNLDSGMSPSYSESSYFSDNLRYGRMLSPCSSGNSSRYNTAVGYNGVNGRRDSVLSSMNGIVWGDQGLNNPSSFVGTGGYSGTGGGTFGMSFRNGGPTWGTLISAQGGRSSSEHADEIESGGSTYGLGEMYGKNTGIGAAPLSSLVASATSYEGSYENLYGNTDYSDSAWRSASASSVLDDCGSFVFGLDSGTSDAMAKNSEDYIESFSIANRQSNRGVAA